MRVILSCKNRRKQEVLEIDRKHSQNKYNLLRRLPLIVKMLKYQEQYNLIKYKKKKNWIRV